METYLDEYRDNVYTWANCHYYTYNYNQIDCNIDLQFSRCTGAGDTCCGRACNTQAFENQLNALQPWWRDYRFTSGYGFWGHNQEFMDYYFKDYLCAKAYYRWESFWFCD